MRPVPAMALLLRWLAARRRHKKLSIGLPVALALFSLAGLATLRVDDDISQLRALPQDIPARGKKPSPRSPGKASIKKWFVIYGKTAQQTLQRTEAFMPALTQAQSDGLLGGYRAIPLNSLARQQQDLALLQRAAPTVSNVLNHAGLATINPDLNPMPVTVDVWLASPASEGWRLLWLTLPDGESGVLVPVSGVKDSAALKTLSTQQAGVAWVDRKSDFDQLFALYRHILTGLLGVALAVIACGAMLRLGWRKGLVSSVPSVLSLGCGLAVLAFSGHAVNLFSLLALVLVLGIGINYTLFFSATRAVRR